jgi:hypothetical protein
MSVTDQLRRILEGKAIAAANAAGLAGKLKLPNNDFTPPKAEPWSNFWFKTGGSKQMELGGAQAFERTVGLIQFDVVVPEKSGDGEIARIADMLRSRFNRKQWLVPPYGVVKMDVASVKTPFGTEAQGGWYRYCVDATFNYDYRDPDALPFDA